jgi:hypothetical protein
MRKTVAVVLLMTLVVTVPAWSAAATRRRETSVPNCHHLQVRPRSIVFACADGGFYVRRLTWSSWDRDRAVGRGVFHQNSCRPSCAEGTFHVATGTIHLSHRIRCADRDRSIFRRVAIRFDRPLLHRDHVAFRVICPNPTGSRTRARP